MKALKRKKNSKSAKEEPNYEQIGRMLVTIYETGYIRPGRMLKMSFIRGIATGFGTVLGATIVVALVVWILSVFSDIPFFGPLFEEIRDPIKTQQPTSE
jgi:hypothetical protein